MTHQGNKPRESKVRVEARYAIVAYLVIAVTILIALRAAVTALAFLSVGWMFALALLPLVPWLLPRLGTFLKEVSPYLQRVRLGSIELELRTLTREPITVPSSGMLAAVPNDVTALSSGTGISELVKALRQLRRTGGGPVGIIDLKDGHKWRLPNLYFLARLLELDPVVSQLVVTETSGGVDGYFVGTCRPGELRRQIELGVPGYVEASQGLRLPPSSDLSDPNEANVAAQAFLTLSNGLPASSGLDSDQVHGYVTSQTMHAMMGGVLSSVAVEALSETLSEDNIRKVLSSPYRFVPTTANLRVTGFIDRDVVALAVARSLTANG